MSHLVFSWETKSLSRLQWLEEAQPFSESLRTAMLLPVPKLNVMQSRRYTYYDRSAKTPTVNLISCLPELEHHAAIAVFSFAQSLHTDAHLIDAYGEKYLGTISAKARSTLIARAELHTLINDLQRIDATLVNLQKEDSGYAASTPKQLALQIKQHCPAYAALVSTLNRVSEVVGMFNMVRGIRHLVDDDQLAQTDTEATTLHNELTLCISDLTKQYHALPAVIARGY